TVVAGGESPPGTVAFGEWSRAGEVRLEPEDTSKDDAAFWLYTSGTTGPPKAAVHLHHDLVAAAELYGQGILGLRPDDICFSASKLFFAYGLGNALYFPLRVGAAAVHFPGRPSPAAIFDTIARRQPTLFFSVPSGYAALLAHAEAQGIDSLGSVRLCISAGEALPATLFLRWK